MNKLITQCLKYYQIAISPLFPSACRFHPTCSQYAIEAIKCHGVAKGSLLSVMRILRCQPLFKGGFDPVMPSDKKLENSP